IAIFALLINGTDYFLIGLMAISSGPIFYIIFKRAKGGLAKNDPEKFPLNPKTKLAVGDLNRISLYCILMGIFAVVGKFFLVWYEGDWGAEYYAEEAESALFSNFEWMLNLLQWGGLAVLALGLILLLIGKKIEPSLKG
ncbi:MAG: hypothetical protein RR661_07655, partial [Anaerovoracaceae bacterium]